MNDTYHGDLLQLFVSGLPDAVALFDVEGNILTCNAGARDVTGYAADEILGQHFSRLYSRDDIAEAKPAVSLRCALARGRHEETGKRVRKDGSEVTVRSVLMPLYDSKKELVGFGNLLRDVASSIPVASDGAATGLVPPRTRETILVVDDDDDVREGVSRQLTSLGYKAVTASNGPDALDMLAREPGIDLLFTDVVMPGGMNGREVAHEARLIRPGLKVLFTSGYFEGALLRDSNIDVSARLIGKPYRKNELARKVQEALSSAPS